MCVSSLYGGAGIPVDERHAAAVPVPDLDGPARHRPGRMRWTRQVDLERAVRDHRQRRGQLLRLHQDAVGARAPCPRCGRKDALLSCRPTAYINLASSTGELAVDHSSAGNIGGVYDAARRALVAMKRSACWAFRRRMMPPRLVESSRCGRGLARRMGRTKLGLAEGMPLMARRRGRGGGHLLRGRHRQRRPCRDDRHQHVLGLREPDGGCAPQAHQRMPHVYRGADAACYAFGGAITAGAAVTWYRDQPSARPRSAEAATHQARIAHRLIERKAVEGAARVAEGLMFLPLPDGQSAVRSGTRRPTARSSASACAHSRAHLYRAVLEGV